MGWLRGRDLGTVFCDRWSYCDVVLVADGGKVAVLWKRTCPKCGEKLQKELPDDAVTCAKCGWKWAHRYVS